MLIIAYIGLAGNLLTAILLFSHSKENLNLKSSFLHILSDLLSSIAIIITGHIMQFYNLYILDPIITFLISAYIIIESIHILKDAITITMQAVPDGVNFEIIKDKIEGIGGYPVGFQERLISLISGGFDSSVSTFSMMKRGCQTDYLFFNLGGNAHELWVKHVSHYLWKRFSAPHKKAKFITVPFEEVVSELLQNVNHKFRGIILKRLMLRAASLIAKNRYYALVKGDSLGQVSSQTLKNMYTIDKASDALVLRPLISMNKQEIINITKQIGTYDFACSMPEYCGVISDNPSAGAKYEDIIEEEAKLPEGLVEKVLEGKKIEFVRDMLDKIEREWEIQEVQGVWEDDIIVDVREPERVKKSPLSHKWYEHVMVIPFYEINHSFKNLDQSKTYLFYCDKWVISKLHGLYLQEKWFHNIKVFRP